MLFRVVFPFTSTYSKLNLRAKWWHRLSVVLFCMITASTFVMSAGIPLMDAVGARSVAISDAYDRLAFEAERSGKYSIDPKTGEAIENAPPLTSPVDLSAGLVPKALPDSTARPDRPADPVKLAKDAHPIHIFEIIGLAVLITVSLSYALQVLYRVAIFVTFGELSKAE